MPAAVMSRGQAPVPIILIQPKQAEDAFAAYAALARLEAQQPTLRTNPYWEALRDAAFARFRAAFEVLQ
jgi:hypothetical protein